MGTKNTDSSVPISMPHSTEVPMARWLAELAPEARYSGTTPRMKANEVIRMGRKRIWAACSAACSAVLPCSCTSLANSMIRMAFFADRPITVIRPT